MNVDHGVKGILSELVDATMGEGWRAELLQEKAKERSNWHLPEEGL